MASTDIEDLQNELRTKRICRFCLSQDSQKLSNIYMRETPQPSSAPLTIQIMAIASIEVYKDDGMPSWVCADCCLLFEHSYQFKQMCKRADTLLRQYPLTGKWPDVLEKPKLQRESSMGLSPTGVKPKSQSAAAANQSGAKSNKNILNSKPRKILNVAPAASPEPPAPVPMKKEKFDDEATTVFLNKVENNEELSLDDVQRLIASEDAERDVDLESVPMIVVNSGTKHTKPKLLNKSSMRILNKEATKDVEPRLSFPQVKLDEDGNMEIVAEILDIDQPYETEPDPIKDAAPVETNVFPCPHCERSFPLRQLRDIHMVNHNRERSFQCDECDKCFFSKYDLQKHTFTHTGDKPFKCSACDKGFTRATLLHRHEKTHTDIPKFICVHCEKPFISREDMEKHAERHKKNRPFQCKLCNKAFAFKQGLERHEVVHSREQPYPCQYCDQSFSTTSKLARHLTAHAGERPYPCKFCPKSYLLSHHLTRHLRSHKNAGNRNAVSFLCNACNVGFPSRDELIEHSATHANETLVCPLCKETSDNIEAVTAHIKEHAEGEAYACEFCDLIFMTAAKLQAHTKVDHTDEMVAYEEDDRAQANKRKQQSQSLQKTEEDEAGDFQKTVDEILIEELFDEREEEGNTKEEANEIQAENIVIKKEAKDKGKQPKIINQIIIKSGTTPTTTNGGNSESLDESTQPPAKLRKLGNDAQESTAKSGNKPKAQAPSLRRKAATAADAKPSSEVIEEKISIKVEKPDVVIAQQKTSINSVLKLPKGVTVRRSTSSSASRASNEKAGSVANVPPKQQTTLLQKKAVGKPPAAPDDKSPPKKAAGSPKSDKGEVVKMIIGDKKVKVHKITVSRSEAAAMAKEGRLRIKDGNMILTQSAPKARK